MDAELSQPDHKSNAGMGKPSPKAEAREIDKEELKSAKELIQFLIKTSRTLKIYLHNNPIHQKFLNELKGKIDRHLEEYSDFKIHVQQHKLLWMQEVLYENTNQMESLAFRLYIDGIRELMFHEGLELGELKDFLEAIGSDPNQTHPDDDITTLFWEKGFSHITYQVAKESAQPLKFTPPPMETAQITKLFAQEVQSSTDSSESTAPAENAEGAPVTEQQIHNLPYKNVYSLSPEEIAKVKHEMHAEEGQDLLGEMIQILTAILRIEENVKDFEEVVRILQDMLMLMINRGDFSHGRRILEIFWELGSPEKGLPEKHRELLTQAIEWAGSKDQIEKLRSVLNNDAVKNIDELQPYLILYYKNAILPLIDLLGSLQNMKSRRILCDVMVELARDDIDILIKRLRDHRWYIVRNVVYILGKIRDERVIEDLAPLIHHEESQVRKEVLRSYEAFPGEKAKQYLLNFLEDKDSSIRILAARSLAHHKVAGTAEGLLGVIESGEFKDRDFYEKKEFFDALGRAGGNTVVSSLQTILKQGSWFKIQKGKDEELKLCAVMALKRVKTPEAVSVLKEGSTLKNKNVREACERVIAELERKMR